MDMPIGECLASFLSPHMNGVSAENHDKAYLKILGLISDNI